MALLVTNLTGAAVVLAAGNPARTVPASSTMDVTSELAGLTGGNYTSLQAQVDAGSVRYAWVGPVGYATSGLTVGGSIQCAQATFLAPIAPELISVVAAATPVAAAVQVIAAQPAHPCKLQLRMVIDTTHAVTAGSAAIVGTSVNGEVISETVSLVTAASATFLTTKAYATVTSITLSNPFTMTGGAAGDTFGVGVSGALALPTGPGATLLSVYRTNVDALYEAAGTVDLTAGTVAPTSAPNAARNFTFWYKYSV